MKKLIISAALSASLLSIASAQTSGFFVGVNAGVPITTPSYSGALSTIKDNLPKTGIGWAIGLDLGYKQALSEDYGLRYYLSYNYNESYGSKNGGSNPMFSKVKADITQQLITANVDFYYNFTPAFGAYIGIGVGYQGFKPSWKPTTPAGELSIGGSNKGGFAFPLNLGLTYNFNETHQILLGAKLPLIAYDYETSVPVLGMQQAQTPPASAPGTSTLRTYIVQIGYSYTF